MSSAKSPQRTESRAGDTEGAPKGQEKVLVRKTLCDKSLQSTRIFNAISFEEVLERGEKVKER